jgi:hypothetical protein
MNCFISISEFREINLYPIEVKTTLLKNSHFCFINSCIFLEDQKIQLTEDQIKEEVLYWYGMKMLNSLNE